MKFFLSLTVLFVFSVQVFGIQPYYAKKHFCCFSYQISFQEQIKNQLATMESGIQINTEGQQSKTEALFYHGIYKIVTELLEDTLEVYNLPPNSLTSKAKYNLYGYPDITIQKAIRLSDNKFFFKIDVTVTNDAFDNEGKRYAEGTFKPQVKILLELFSKEGFDPIHVAEGFAEAPKPIQPVRSFIAGMEFTDPGIKAEKGDITLYNLIQNASLNAIWTLKYTKPKKR